MIALSGTLFKELSPKKEDRGKTNKIVDQQWDIFLDQIENKKEPELSLVQKVENGV